MEFLFKDYYNVKEKEGFVAFSEEVKKHPRYGELRDVLPHIWGYVQTRYKPWERDFYDYLQSSNSPNMLTWLYAKYGDTYKFPVKKSLVKKRESYDLIEVSEFTLKVALCFCPFMTYFKSLYGVDRTLDLDDYAKRLDDRYRLVYDSNVYTEVVFFYYNPYEGRYYEKWLIETKRFSSHVFTAPSSFLGFFKNTLLKKRFTYIDRVEVRLKNVPENIRVNPNFSLTFDKRTHECFYKVLEK